MHKFKYATAGARAYSAGRVAVGCVSGILTASIAREVIADSELWLPGGEALAVVADYSGAAIALSASDLLGAIQRIKWGGDMAPPTALVVASDQMAMFREYAARCATLGILRAVFASVDDAQRWAARQALVRQHWQAVARAQQSSQQPTHKPIVAEP